MAESKLMISKSDLSKIEDSALNIKQLNFLLQRTPKNHIYSRPAKGGGTWNFVTGTYVKKVLNLMFGFDWSFEVEEHKFDLGIKQAYVLGKLTVNSNGKSIIKMQFGRQDIKMRKGTNIPLDIGNDLKGATTDALKKCASELGIASDVYAPNEFKAVTVLDDADYEDVQLKEVVRLLGEAEEYLQEDEIAYIQEAIENGKTKVFPKIIKMLQDGIQKR